MAFFWALVEVTLVSLLIDFLDEGLFQLFGITRLPHVFTFSLAVVALRRVVELRSRLSDVPR